MGFLLWCGQGLIVPYGAARLECGCPGAEHSDIGTAVRISRIGRPGSSCRFLPGSGPFPDCSRRFPVADFRDARKR